MFLQAMKSSVKKYLNMPGTIESIDLEPKRHHLFTVIYEIFFKNWTENAATGR